MPAASVLVSDRAFDQLLHYLKQLFHYSTALNSTLHAVANFAVNLKELGATAGL